MIKTAIYDILKTILDKLTIYPNEVQIKIDENSNEKNEEYKIRIYAYKSDSDKTLNDRGIIVGMHRQTCTTIENLLNIVGYRLYTEQCKKDNIAPKKFKVKIRVEDYPLN